MTKNMTVQEFFNRFPNDNACLEHLMETRFGIVTTCPKCHRKARFAKLTKVRAYSCPGCGHHIHPMAGTPFERSSTPLQKWFYAIYLFTTSRHGVPAKELQRQIGVTYKCAWRMGHQIRKYMAIVDGDDNLSGHVEADETYIGGRRPGKRGRGAYNKTIVFGILQRGGNILTKIIPNVKRATLESAINEHVEKGSELSTDELLSYAKLATKGYRHSTVKHSKGEYVNGNTHTNGIEGFWSMIKRSIKGTHIHVSRQHLHKYLGEFEFRYNMRKTPELMFDRLLLNF